MAQFQINFTDPKGFYYEGETVAGNATVVLREEMRFHKLTIKFKGKSYCRWTTGSGDGRKSHWNHEDYFKEKVILLTAASSSNDIWLGPGEYNYPFSFHLPTNLPPTFESARDTGYVRYYMKVAFDMDSILKSDIEAKIPFIVVATPSDLDLRPNLLEPVNDTREKLLCCLCCQSGPIRLRCQLNKQAFYIGEPIIFSVEVDNRETDKDLRKVEAMLVKEVVLISTTSWKERHHFPESSVVLTQGVQARAEESWQNIRLNIPANITPSFENCKCVHVNYQFVVAVDIPSAIDTSVTFPITVANGIQTSQPLVNPPMIHDVPPVQQYGMPSAPSAGMYQQAYPPPIVAQPPPSQPPPPYPVDNLTKDKSAQ